MVPQLAAAPLIYVLLVFIALKVGFYSTLSNGQIYQIMK